MLRFDLIIDCTLTDDAAIMHETEHGHYVKHKDARERIDYLVSALQNLKGCNSKLNTAEELNNYVDAVLEGYL